MKLLAVLDSDNKDAMVIGWAASYAQAVKAARQWELDHGGECITRDVNLVTVNLQYNPDVHMLDEIERHEANGESAWVVTRG